MPAFAARRRGVTLPVMNREASPASDEELVARFVADPEGAGGRAAADALIRRWSTRVYQWARRWVHDHEKALDLAQESLLQMFQGLPRYEPRGRFPAWLFVIVHHCCLASMRRRSLDYDPEIEMETLCADGPGPAEELESAERRERIFTAMDRVLDERERAALWLRAWEGMSVEDITRVLDVDGTSGGRGLLQTARRKLRAALREEGGEEEGSG